ncbi:phosphatidylserine/phosphatidylglycerophosphate/cardiolipin synthase family protein [Streptomyces sp. NPDC059816]|uniref:phospholipase D-like domain-containing protein n=1 Tax=Streptomyces sp. NPDC059816 TaxID=3346960 RepID=UPI00364B49F2
MRRRTSRSLVALATATLGVTLLTPTAAQAEEVTTGNYTATFNYTKPNGSNDTSISTGLGTLIDLAKPGSTLYMSMYWLSDANGIEAKLLAAHARNVTVKVVIESFTNVPQALKTGLTGNSKLTECYRGCLDNPDPEDDKAINHNKFVVFDELTDGRTNVVWQSSQNMSPSQNGELNNAITVSGNVSLAIKYRAAFTRQVSRAGVTGTVKYNSTYDAPTASVEPIFFPRDTGTGPTDTGSDHQVYGNPDIVAHQIEKVDCAKNGRIRLATSSLNGKALRPAIYTALEDRRKAGCAVDAVVRDFDALDANAGVNDMTGINVNAYSMRPGGCRYIPSDESCNHGTVHSKYLLTEWENAQGQRVQNTYTGSHNFTKGALVRNDETLLRLSDAGVYDAFVANFNKLRSAVVDIDAAKYGSTSQHYSRVNAASAGDQHDSATASNGSGTSTYQAVVYEDGDNHNPADTQLGTNAYLRMYKDGVPLWNEKQLSVSGAAGTSWSHQKPDVGVDRNGNAIVVWAGDDDGNKYANIEVRKIDQAGNVTVLPRPHASADGHQLRPTVAVADDGSYTVAWEDTANGTTLNQVKASGWSATGTRSHPDVQVSTINSGATAGSNRRPDAAVDGAGNTAIVWEEDADGNGGINIGLAKLNATGGFAVPRKVANSLTDGQQTEPAVAQAADGRTVATWADVYVPGTGSTNPARAARIQHRTFSATGAPVAAETVTTPGADSKRAIGVQVDPDVAVSDAGDFVVAWRETFVDGKQDVWARGFNADGGTGGRLPTTRMNVVTGHDQTDPAVSLAPNGRLALTYSDDYDNDSGGFNELRLRDGFLNK